MKSENGKEKMDMKDIKRVDNKSYGNWLVEETEEKERKQYTSQVWRFDAMK